MPEQFDAISVVRRTGQEKLRLGHAPTEFSLLDFWQWSCSDLVNNTLRGRFAEYIVACAMGLNSGTRIEWDAHDLLCVNNVPIEVKSAAYLQSWKQPKHSAISFDIALKQSWDALTSTYKRKPDRPAQIYVFCVLHHKDKLTLDALNLSQWTFYVLRTSVLNETKPTQKRISLGPLRKLKPRKCRFGRLKKVLDDEMSKLPSQCLVCDNTEAEH